MRTIMQTTSLEAYEEVKKTLGKRQARVFNLLYYSDPTTNSELAAQLGWPINTVTPRVFELRGKGFVKEDCRRKCAITGRTAITWRVKRPDEIKEHQREFSYGRR